MASMGVAYLLWLFGFVGVCGLHRFYVGKPISGILWLCTFGFLWIGQLLDIILIPGMVARANIWAYGGGNRNTNVVNVQVDAAGSGRRRRRSRDDDYDDYEN